MDNCLLEVKNMRVSYNGGRKPVIKGVDLSIEAGTLTALLGLNGSGKTTLLKAACGLLPSESEKWMVCDRPASAMGEKERAACISYIPQKHSIMYHISVEEVALMGINPHLKRFEVPSKDHKKLVGSMIEYMGMGHLAQEDFLSLSEGQKQLVILTRAMVQNAPVMMFDEPDCGLDYENRRNVYEKIRHVIADKRYGGLITIHDPDYALRYCDKILLLRGGLIKDTIDCQNIEREAAERKLRILYPELRLLKYENCFLTVK